MVTVDRHLGIGSSDATRIIKGEWLDLYNEKKGLAEREDLSGVFRVQLGTYTEPFHLDWLNDQMGYDIVSRGDRFSVDSPVPMFCHLDGITAVGIHVECKATPRHVHFGHRRMYLQLYCWEQRSVCAQDQARQAVHGTAPRTRDSVLVAHRERRSAYQ